MIVQRRNLVYWCSLSDTLVNTGLCYATVNKCNYSQIPTTQQAATDGATVTNKHTVFICEEYKELRPPPIYVGHRDDRVGPISLAGPGPPSMLRRLCYQVLRPPPVHVGHRDDRVGPISLAGPGPPSMLRRLCYQVLRRPPVHVATGMIGWDPSTWRAQGPLAR